MAPPRPSKKPAASAKTSKPVPKATTAKGKKSGVAKPAAPQIKKKPVPPPRKVVPASQAEDDEESTQEQSGSEAENDGTSRQFRAGRLKPKVRTVPRRVIYNNWGKLSEACQEDIMDMVKLAERPVLMSFPNDRSKKEAQAATRQFIAILQKKLDKVPVPGKDARLSREVLIEKNKAAEAALEPTLSEIAELEKELEKEKEALREEEKFLEQLTFNAQAEEKFREEKAQMMPRSLLADPSAPKAPTINLNTEMELYEAASSYQPDRQIRSLVEQLEGHLQTMHSNAGILEEVPDLIWKARTSVEQVLDRIDGGLYDTVSGV